MVGISKNTVTLCPFSQEWNLLFEQEKLSLYKTIGDYVVDIQHVGSTSIKDMPAKPIIDIVVGLKDFNDGFKLIDKIEALGYHFKGSLGNSNRFFFWKGSEDNNTHNLHLTEYGDKNWNNQVLFRDFINSHPDYKDKYLKLKMELASNYKEDRSIYTQSKSEFIAAVINLATKETQMFCK